MLTTSLLDDRETFVAVGRRTGARWIVILPSKDPTKPHAQYFKTREGEEVAALGGGMYLILPTGEILTQPPPD
jgi:hypothetical protein